MLAANMAFLSIPDIDQGFGARSRTGAQIACYLSVVASTSGLILGVLLTRQYIFQGPKTAQQMVSATGYTID
jgi:hypothetical protein